MVTRKQFSIFSGNLKQYSMGSVTPKWRALFGFLFGLVVMVLVTRIFIVNHFDFDNMRRGVIGIMSGINPWEYDTRLQHYYNPPFAVIFLSPLMFTTPKTILVIGGALLWAFIFYYRAWVAIAWFLTNTFLFIVAAGGVDMYLMGAGMFLLVLADQSANKRWVTLIRVLAYGFLLVKPQGGLFIVLFYICLRRDWKGVLVSIFLYGVLFAWLYPDWMRVLLTDPPLAQTEAAHSLNAKFGLGFSIFVAVLVCFARPWKYWQLGGALAGILAPYGMPGLPIFLVLTAIPRLAAIPAIILYSAGLALTTWVAPQSPLLGVYHLGMLALALIIACLSPDQYHTPDPDLLDFRIILKNICSQKLIKT